MLISIAQYSCADEIVFLVRLVDQALDNVRIGMVTNTIDHCTCMSVCLSVAMLLLFVVMATIESKRNLKIYVSLASFIHRFAKSNCHLHIEYTRALERTLIMFAQIHKSRLLSSDYEREREGRERESGSEGTKASAIKPHDESDNRHK